MTPVINPEQLLRFQKAADAIHVADALLDYLQNLLEYSRVNPDFNTGLSPRAGLAVLNCARAWALIHGHQHVLPEDVQAVLPSVISHRLYANQEPGTSSATDLAEILIKRIPIP